MTAPPVQTISPGLPGFCPPYARYDKDTGALVPINGPVNCGKSKSAVPTNPNNFIAKAATYVRTEVAVPKEAVPTNSLVQISFVGPVPVPKAATHSPVPISSVGPVPLAVAADSPGAAGTPAPENGDQILLYFSPLTTVTTLEYQGLATLFLRSSDPKHQQFSSTGHLPDIVDAKPPMELIKLVPPGPPPFVTSTADIEHLGRLTTTSALISPSPVHMSPLYDNRPLNGTVDRAKTTYSATMDFTRAAPPTAAHIVPGRPLQAPSCCGHRPRRPGRPAVHPRHLHFPLFEQEGQTS